MRKIFLIYLVMVLCCSSAIANITVKQLEGKDIFRAYLPKMFFFGLSDDQIEEYQLQNLPIIGTHKEGESFLAVFHGVKEYQNSQGETRQVAIVEYLPLTDYNGDLDLFSGCHACSSDLSLLLFKPIKNGYQLLASYDYEAWGDWGRADLISSLDEMRLVQLGKNTMGLLYEDFSTGAGGTYESILNAILLRDDGVREVQVAFLGTGSGGMYPDDSPLAYGYEGTWEVDASDLDREYYPILIHYQGDDFEIDEQGNQNFIDMNLSHMYEYNGSGDAYHLIKSFKILQ